MARLQKGTILTGFTGAPFEKRTFKIFCGGRCRNKKDVSGSSRYVPEARRVGRRADSEPREAGRAQRKLVLTF